MGRPDELCVGRELQARHAPVLGQRRRQATLPAPTRPERQRRADTIRWECLRDGAEDYEYFVLLERLVRQAEGRRVDARLLQRARELLRVPRAVAADMTAFTHDPRVVNAYRTKLARVIERLQRR